MSHSDGVGSVALSAQPRIQELDLISFLVALRRRWLLVGVITLTFLSVGVAYAVFAARWYRSEALLIASKSNASGLLGSQLGGLGSLVGLSLPDDSGAEPLAVLKSREFARGFIERHDLMPVLFAEKWDSSKKSWHGEAREWPDLGDAVTYLQRKVSEISQDRKSGLVKVAIEWKDPVLAAQWARAMIQDLNTIVSQRDLERSTENVTFLQQQLAQAGVVSVQQPLGRLLEMELQKSMLARHSDGYAFRVIDSPEVARRPVWPRTLVITAACGMLGAFVAMFVVLLLDRRSIVRAA